MPDLSIVIVSWNVRDLLQACLESIQASHCESQPEVIVVDSASSDGAPQMVRRQFPWAHLIEAGHNVGFSKGNNMGIEASTGRYVLLLNPDTKIIGEALSEMIGYMESHPQVGVLGPQLLNEDMSVQSSRRRFPTLWTAFFESTWLQPYAPRRIIDTYTMRDHSDDQVTEVDWVTGAAMLVRRQVIEQIGGFDEGFFMYSEELDWQRRIRSGGWQIIYFPQAQIIHYGGKSSEQAVAQRHIYFQTSKIRYFRKYHGEVAGVVLRIFLLANYVWQLSLEAVKGLIGHKRTMRWERVRAYWQVLRSGLRG
jgi:GT2 family glycosyltransferase